MNSDPFITIKQFGDLSITRVFTYYDYPRVFVCEDVIGTKYLFSQSDFDDTWDEWVVVPISHNKFFNLCASQLTLDEALNTSESGKFYLISKDYKTNKVDVIESKDPYPDKVTRYPVYVGYKPESPEEQDIMKESYSNQASFIDLTFNSDNHENFVSPENMKRGITGGVYLCATQTNFKPMVTAMQGSLVLRFTIPNWPGPILSSSDASDPIKRLNMIVSSDNPVEIMALLGDNNNVKKYIKFLQNIEKTSTDILITSMSPNYDSSLKVNLKHESIMKKRQECENLLKDTKKTVEVDGILDTFSVSKRKFKVVSPNFTYDGSVNAKSTIEEGKIIINNRYTFVIDIIYSNLDNKKPKGHILRSMKDEQGNVVLSEAD